MEISHLEWIHSFGAGVDSFMKLNLPKDCTLTKTKGKMGQRMSEYCLTYILQDLNKTDLFKINQGTAWDGQYLYDLYKSASLPWEWHKELYDLAKSEGLICFSSQAALLGYHEKPLSG